MKLQKRIKQQRVRRTFRVRNRLRKSASGRPRLSVCRSNKNISVQIIDDDLGRTLTAASTAESPFKGASGGNKAAAAKLGKLIAERAIEQGIKEVAFDRGQYQYHGRVAALADAAREAGLSF